MARATLKLKRPITEFEVDLDENWLEVNGYTKVIRCKDCRKWCVCHHNDDYFCADGESNKEEP